MLKSKLIVAALAVSSMGFIPVAAQADRGIFVDVAPPAGRHEILPAARPGYVWQPGYYDWRSNRHHWVKGYWVKERRGMHWHPNRWEQRDGRWTLERGAWNRDRYVMSAGRGGPRGDRDRDGVPNRVDRDRDGDGVRNSRDRAPDNPRRN